MIVSSLLAVLAKAELRFFHTESFAPPVVPTTAKQCLELADSVSADGQTAPGLCATLKQQQKKKNKTKKKKEKKKEKKKKGEEKRRRRKKNK